MTKFKIGEIVKIVGSNNEFPIYNDILPKNLITKITNEYSSYINCQPVQYEKGEGGQWCAHHRIRKATDREKFLYLFEGKPFILEQE